MTKYYYMSLFAALLFMSMKIYAEPVLYGIYSNFNAEEEELSGMEMFFLNDGRAGKCDQSILFQVAEGWPQYPELLDCCACSAGNIQFQSKNWGKFIGHVDNGHLIGEFTDSKHTVKLKRGKSYWQK